MTDAAARLAARIRLEGPVSVAVLMAEVGRAYYAERPPFGAGGDFVTAPEVSQMFGELLGAWAAAAWTALGAPRPARLVELGPGRGTLLADALRAVRRHPFAADLALHLVETSPALRAEQAARLTSWLPRFHDLVSEVPPGPAVLVANEFLDALPIRQFLRVGGGWAERRVALDPDSAFRFVAVPVATAHLIPAPWRDTAPDGALIEVSPAVEALAAELGRRAATEGWVALLIDYGEAEPDPGDSLQAVRAHRRVPPLAEIGAADLSARVDFGAVARAAAAAGAAVAGPEGQGSFLRRLGIAARAAALRARDPGVDAALARLTEADAMGTLFQVLAILPPAAAPALRAAGLLPERRPEAAGRAARP